MDFFLPVTWSSQSAKMEVNRVRLGIKKDPPIRSELSAVKGGCMSARSSGIFWRSFLFSFYFIFPFAATLRVVSLSRVPTGEISKEPTTQPIDFLLLGWMEGERLLSSLFHSFSSSRHRYSVNTKQTTTTFSTKSRAPEHDFHPLPTVTPMIDRQIPSIILANR
jgi:hypothetical protein